MSPFSRYRFLTADVFTDQAFGGNPLAVLPDARGLDDGRMQAIAREFNLSETVFVLPPDDPGHTRKLRIFTPATELPFAGHPTVGTAFVLAAIGEIALAGAETGIVFEEGVGPVPVTIRAENGAPVFSQLSAAVMPEVGPPPPPAGEIAAALSLEENDLLLGDWAPEAVSCGVPFLFVPLKSRDAVARARLDRAAWSRRLAGYWAPSLYVFSMGGERAGSHFHARSFVPAMGVEEDPATGAAATALAGYLGARDESRSGSLRWVVEQGFEMGRPSLLDVEADKRDGAVVAIRVGGASVLISEGTIDVPESA